MTYDEALEYIHGISWTFCKPGLERIGQLCELLGHPERGLKFVHVAGTNGKGSFCSMLSSILQAAGLCVGLYTSPYVKAFNERMQINGESIADAELCELTEYVKPYADSMTDSPTEFELITAIAFEYFKRHECDVVVLEAGLGGRLDSTNIIREPLLSVITGIALEHTAILGDTVQQIAAEKAGIIKDGAPILYGGDSREAADVISRTAVERGSEFYRTDAAALEIVKAALEGSHFNYKGRRDVYIPLLGLYQPKNAALVLEAVDILKKRGLTISEDAVRVGFERAVWHARFEIIDTQPLTIFDGAHNPQGIEMAVQSIKHYFDGRGVCLVTGVLKDKDYTQIAEILATVAHRAFVITPDSPRALAAQEYAQVLGGAGMDAVPCESVDEALRAARAYALREGLPVICLGSLYVYVEVCRALGI